MKLSNILLISGFIVLGIGVGMSIAEIKPYSDYVLIGGAALVFLRGAARRHEKTEGNKKE